VEDINADDLLLTLHGKGRKDRIVPISLEFRKAVFRYLREYEPKGWLLATKGGDRLGRCVMLRNVKELCRELGFEPPSRTLHAFRHTWAVNYVRQGGSVFHLQRALGHSTLEMSRRYSSLNTTDLSAMQETTSMLRRLG
jgi:integrase/recombinase XerD